jgi:hypothetical protein
MAPALHWETWLPFLAFLLYALLLTRYMGAYAGGSDSSGYLNNARLLSEGRLIAPLRLLPGLAPDTLPPYTHVPLGFIPNADHVTMTPTYPMGLPLLIMAAAKITGWNLAPALVMGLHALLGLWLVYRLGRECGLEKGWVWLGVLMLAFSPLYLFMSLQVMSDVPAMVWATAAVLCAWKSRQAPWLALVAGMALSLAVLLRPSNMLGFVPVGIAVGFAVRRWLLLILGGLPGAIFLGIINHAAYGRIFTTGYGYVDPVFSRAYVPATLVHYALWLPVLLTPLVLLSLAFPFLRHRQPLLTALLAAWGLAYPFFYLFYRHTHDDWWYLRFLLPAFPPLILAALLVARAVLDRCQSPFRAWWLAVTVVIIIGYNLAWSRHLHVYGSGYGERIYPETTTWVSAHLPAGAVVATMQASGALLYYTDYTILRWDMISSADFKRIAAACTAAGRPLYAVLFPFEIEEAEWSAFQKHLAGHWTQIGTVRYVSIWRYDSPPAP